MITIKNVPPGQVVKYAPKTGLPHDSVTKLGRSTRKLEIRSRKENGAKSQKMNLLGKNRLTAFDATSFSRYSTSY